jgi:hypothetical protein
MNRKNKLEKNYIQIEKKTLEKHQNKKQGNKNRKK